MKKNTEIIDDGTEDLVAPIIPVVPVKPEDVSTPTVPQEETPAQIISPTEPEVIKNPLEELEKQKDNIPLPPTEEEAKIITEEKEVSGDYPMISGDKVINMLRIILL